LQIHRVRADRQKQHRNRKKEPQRPPLEASRTMLTLRKPLFLENLCPLLCHPALDAGSRKNHPRDIVWPLQFIAGVLLNGNSATSDQPATSAQHDE